MPERPTLLAGLAAAVLAVSPPVDGRAADSLVWHMAQHLVLLAVAAPLLVVAGLRRWDAPVRTTSLPVLLALVGAHVVVVTAWHLPPLFDGAERSLPLHVVEHLTFLASAAALWWAAGLGSRPAPPVTHSENRGGPTRGRPGSAFRRGTPLSSRAAGSRRSWRPHPAGAPGPRSGARCSLPRWCRCCR